MKKATSYKYLSKVKYSEMIGVGIKVALIYLPTLALITCMLLIYQFID